MMKLYSPSMYTRNDMMPSVTSMKHSIVKLIPKFQWPFLGLCIYFLYLDLIHFFSLCWAWIMEVDSLFKKKKENIYLYLIFSWTMLKPFCFISLLSIKIFWKTKKRKRKKKMLEVFYIIVNHWVLNK